MLEDGYILALSNWSYDYHFRTCQLLQKFCVAVPFLQVRTLRFKESERRWSLNLLLCSPLHTSKLPCPPPALLFESAQGLLEFLAMNSPRQLHKSEIKIIRDLGSNPRAVPHLLYDLGICLTPLTLVSLSVKWVIVRKK